MSTRACPPRGGTTAGSRTPPAPYPPRRAPKSPGTGPRPSPDQRARRCLTTLISVAIAGEHDPGQSADQAVDDPDSYRSPQREAARAAHRRNDAQTGCYLPACTPWRSGSPAAAAGAGPSMPLADTSTQTARARRRRRAASAFVGGVERDDLVAGLFGHRQSALVAGVHRGAGQRDRVVMPELASITFFRSAGSLS